MARTSARAWQRMLSGRRLDILDPSPMDVELSDIAHGLARVARWNGQTEGDYPFSVAQHSVLVLELFLTSSRGAFIGMLAACLVFAYRRRGLVGALGIVVLLLGGLILVPTDLGARLWTVLGEGSAAMPSGVAASNRAHEALFWAALRMIGDNPIFGVGPLNFKSLSTLYTGLPQGNIADPRFRR